MFVNELVVISILLLSSVLIRYQIHSLILRPFYWNQTTFRSYQDNSLIFEVYLGDAMDLICPFYDDQQPYMFNELEQYDIYHVTKTEYDMCHIDQYDMNSITRLLISCNSPYDVMKYTLNFRSYLPIPNGLEFHSNQSYYFLSISSIHHRCNKLKIIVYDHNRISSSINEQERNSIIFSPHSSESSSNNKHLLPHLIKAQRHSNSYLIQWITENSNQMKDSDKSNRTMNSIDPSNIFSLALSSSSTKFSISSTFVLLLTCLR